MNPINGVSVIIPCYNEADAIAETVGQVRAVLGRLNVPGEVIVVDDGSTDATAARVDTTNCRLVRHGENRGYGAALISGAREARYDCLVITDADGTYPIAEIPALVAQLAEAEMAVGARQAGSAALPWARRPAKWALGKLANYVTATRIPDINSGLRAIRRALWDRFEHIFPRGFSLTTTITLAALTSGCRVKFHPIEYRPRVGQSKIRPVRDTVNFIMVILRTTLLFDPLRVFVPLSLIMLAASGLIGFGTLALFYMGILGRFWDTTTTVLFLASIQLLALGGIADVIIRTRR